MDEVLQYQQRIDRVRSIYRKSINGITLEELKFAAGKEYTSRLNFKKLLALVNRMYSEN